MVRTKPNVREMFMWRSNGTEVLKGQTIPNGCCHHSEPNELYHQLQTDLLAMLATCLLVRRIAPSFYVLCLLVAILADQA